MTGRNQAGFTLIEMLVALVLASMVATTLLLGYRTVISTWRRVSTKVDLGQQVDAAASRVSDVLAQAYPAETDDIGNRHVDFTGTASSIEFLAPLVESFGASVVARYRLHFDPDGALHLVSHLDFASTDQPDRTQADMVLLKDLSAGAFDYFGRDGHAGSASWHDQWSERGTLPELIRMRVAPRNPQLTPVAPIIVAPLLTAGASCAFDPIDGRCRIQ